MASLIGFGRRLWTSSHPPTPAKEPDAIRIGLFGASWIAPGAVITPAESHPGVIVAAVAARDLKKAQAYAKKHGIPNVMGSYQELLDDSSIDAVYIPLPNGLHYEWTIRALRAGKHVLVEKPFVSNASEATSLTTIYNAIPSPQRPILLEAVHYLFHPGWQTFLSLLSPSHIVSAKASLSAPAYFFAKDDIRFVYGLAGGTMMDMGTYAASAMRQVFGGGGGGGADVMPEECTAATPRLMPKGWDQQCDQAMRASFRFGAAATAEIDVDLAKSKWGVLPGLDLPCVIVKHAEMPIAELRGTGKGSAESKVDLKEGESHVVTRTATMWNFVLSGAWHRIDIHDEHAVKDAEGKVIKWWSTKESKKAYTWGDLANEDVARNGEGGGPIRVGEEYWSTYRYMLEEFVNKIKGRPGSGVWVDGQESINGMVMIDQVYEKCGLPARPTSAFK